MYKILNELTISLQNQTIRCARNQYTNIHTLINLLLLKLRCGGLCTVRFKYTTSKSKVLSN